MIARHGMILITGGGSGVMEAAGRGARVAGGLTVGILPSETHQDANPYCDVVIPTGFGHGRNALTALAGDVVVVLGGGAGTMTEIGFSWIQGKPLLALDGHGGWAERLAGTAVDARRHDTVTRCRDLDHLERELLSACRKLGLHFS